MQRNEVDWFVASPPEGVELPRRYRNAELSRMELLPTVCVMRFKKRATAGVWGGKPQKADPRRNTRFAIAMRCTSVGPS